MSKAQWWASADQGNPLVKVNITTWTIILDAYLTPWVRHVFDGKRVDLLCPHHEGHAPDWKKLTVRPGSIHAMRSIAFGLRRYANSSYGTRMGPSRATLAASTGYGEGGLKSIDTHLERLERYGWISKDGERTTPSGYVNIYRATVPKAIVHELEPQWHADAAPNDLKTHVATIDAAIRRSELRAEGGQRLREDYVQSVA